jgi:hypothetical protein
VITKGHRNIFYEVEAYAYDPSYDPSYCPSYCPR